MALNKPTASVIALVLLPIITAPMLVGDVNPPPGPVTGTMKPLSQVEPRTPVETLPSSAFATRLISQPGSYYLTGNLSVAGGSLSGIEIATSNVTLDLSGFTLSGNGATADGIEISGASLTSIVIRNGTISGWTTAIFGSPTNSLIEGICCTNNTGGISGGTSSIVRNCTARNSGFTGIAVGAGSLVVDCTATNNGVTGIALGGGGAQAVHCSAYDNLGKGILGQEGSSIIECTAAFNNTSGIEVTVNTLVQRNNSFANDTDIHVLGNRNRIEGNMVSATTHGIKVEIAGNLIIQNTVSAAVTAYEIVGTQTIGPIITATGTIVSENPWANFVF